jgi:hypothetical protein
VVSAHTNRFYFFFGLSFVCVRAEPAMLFCAGVDFGFAKTFAALLATDELVFSFFAMGNPFEN